MSETDFGDHGSNSGGLLKYILLAVGGVYIVLSLYLILDMRSRAGKLESTQTAAAAVQEKLARNLADSQASIKALAAKQGMTEEQLAQRTADLLRQQRAAEARLAQQQKQQLGEVSGQIAGVKGEVGAVKTDVGTVRTDLEATKSKLERVMGDQGQMSGLIARTRDELDWLKRRGERNYYEFTLTKSKRPIPVSTVSLLLKKTDPKRGKFTLNVISDDRSIEKKDRTLFEPMQFYSGRDRQLFELVVFTVEKDKVTGYLSTPKTIPPPAGS